MPKKAQDNAMEAATDPNASKAPNTPPPGGRTQRARSGHNDSVTAGLQRMFAAVADEPIPDEFMQLLDSIEAGVPLLRPGAKDGRFNGGGK